MSDKKAKAKSQNLPKRARKSRAPKMSSMPGKRKAKSRGEVLAVSNLTYDPTSFSEGPVSHPRLGRGQRFVGEQQLTQFVTTASDNQLFSGTSPSSSGINFIYLSPDVFNGRLALQASLYARYRFIAIDFQFKTLCSASQTGGFALGVITDANAQNDSTWNYTTTKELVPSVDGPFRENCVLRFRYPRGSDETWYTRQDSASIAGVRLTCQGQLVGFPSQSSLGALTLGTLTVKYAIEMYQPTPSESLVLLSRIPQRFRARVVEYARKLEKEEELEKTLGEHKDLLEVPMSRQNTAISQSTSSATTASTGSTSSGFRAPAMNEQYVLVSSLKH